MQTNKNFPHRAHDVARAILHRRIRHGGQTKKNIKTDLTAEYVRPTRRRIFDSSAEKTYYLLLLQKIFNAKVVLHGESTTKKAKVVLHGESSTKRAKKIILYIIM